MKTKKFNSLLKAVLIVVGIGGLLFAASAMAATPASGGASTLSGIQTNLQGSVAIVAKILVMMSTLAGIGFIMASFFKFHQHKQQPQQVPMSQGISLVLIGAAMVVFPYLLTPVSKAVFGNTVAGISGASITGVIGGK